MFLQDFEKTRIFRKIYCSIFFQFVLFFLIKSNHSYITHMILTTFDKVSGMAALSISAVDNETDKVGTK